MPRFQTLPDRWLLSDARNDARLAEALAALPRGSGFVFRHYHLEEAERRETFARYAPVARDHGHCVVLSGSREQAREWGSDGVYGPTERLGPPGEMLRIASAHDRAELDAAVAAQADGVFLSPVFATRSHPDADTLGGEGFLALARTSPIPVIALGGMTAARATALGWRRWGAIDGLGDGLGPPHPA